MDFVNLQYVCLAFTKQSSFFLACISRARHTFFCMYWQSRWIRSATTIFFFSVKKSDVSLANGIGIRCSDFIKWRNNFSCHAENDIGCSPIWSGTDTTAIKRTECYIRPRLTSDCAAVIKYKCANETRSHKSLREYISFVSFFTSDFQQFLFYFFFFFQSKIVNFAKSSEEFRQVLGTPRGSLTQICFRDGKRLLSLEVRYIDCTSRDGARRRRVSRARARASLPRA